MSIQHEDLSKVSSMADYLKDLYTKMEMLDSIIHPAMEDVRLRLTALEMAEDPELQARRAEIEEHLAAGKSFEPIIDDLLRANL